GSLASPATIKGDDARGIKRSTLWWRRPIGGPIELVAQCGTQAAEVPEGAQWKSFNSLAIAEGRGPIVHAALVPRIGGMTKATANGVWAMDFTQTLRLLFQTGVTEIEGKTISKFTLLNATPGATGVTRSFNDEAQVAWVATFSDKSQALVITEIP